VLEVEERVQAPAPEVAATPTEPVSEAASERTPAWPHMLASLFSAWSWGMVIPVRFYFFVVVLQMPIPLAALFEGIALGGPRMVRGALTFRSLGVPPRALAGVGVLLANGARPLLALLSTSGGWLPALGIVGLEALGLGARRASGSGSRAAQLSGALLGAITTAALMLAQFDVRDAFVFSALPGALGVLFALLVRLSTNEPSAVARGAMRASGPRFWMLVMASAAAGFGTLSVSIFLLRLASLDQPLPMLALAAALWLGVGLALHGPAGRLRERWGALPALLTSHIAILLGTALWVTLTEAWQGWVALALLAFGGSIGTGAARTLVRLYTGEGAEGASALHDALRGAAIIMGNALAGIMWVIGGTNTAFGYAAWALAVGLAWLVAWLPWLRRGFVGA
jgi:hypothetical protein